MLYVLDTELLGQPGIRLGTDHPIDLVQRRKHCLGLLARGPRGLVSHGSQRDIGLRVDADVAVAAGCGLRILTTPVLDTIIPFTGTYLVYSISHKENAINKRIKSAPLLTIFKEGSTVTTTLLSKRNRCAFKTSLRNNSLFIASEN